MNASTHYDTLEISHKAGIEVIKGAYKFLSQKWHPDKNPDNKATAERMAKALNEAYTVLSNPELKRKYDESLQKEQYSTKNSYQEPVDEKSAYVKPTSKGRNLVPIFSGLVAILMVAGVMMSVFNENLETIKESSFNSSTAGCELKTIMSTNDYIACGIIPGKEAQNNSNENSDVYKIQNKLNSLGYYNGSITGVINNETEDAIYRFQKDRGGILTGKADFNTLKLLRLK